MNSEKSDGNNHWLQARWWGCCNIWFLLDSRPHLAFQLINKSQMRIHVNNDEDNNININVVIYFIVSYWVRFGTMRLRICKHPSPYPSQSKHLPATKYKLESMSEKPLRSLVLKFLWYNLHFLLFFSKKKVRVLRTL